MGKEKALFAFGCSKIVCDVLRSWLFQSEFFLEEYHNYKRVWADVSRQEPSIIFINVDREEGIQLIDALRENTSSPLLVGISSGVDRAQLFRNMFSHSLADYYTQRPIQRGFLDILMARILSDSTIVQEHNKVDLRELTDMVEQRDALKEENRNLQEKFESLVPQRDRLQLQLAELLSASSKYGAEIEKLKLDYEQTLSVQEDKYEGLLQEEKVRKEELQKECDRLTIEQSSREEQITVLQHQLEELDNELVRVREELISEKESSAQEFNATIDEQNKRLSSYAEFGAIDEIQAKLEELTALRAQLQSLNVEEEQRIVELESELAQIRQDASRAAQENESLQKKVAIQEERITALQEKEQEFLSLGGEESELQKMYDQVRHSGAVQAQEEEILRNSLELIQSEKKELERELKQLRLESMNMDEELSFLRVEKEGLDSHLDELEGLSDEKDLENESLHKKVCALEEERNLLREAQLSREERVLSVEKDLRTLRETYEALQKEHKVALEELEPLREDMMLLQVQIDEDQIETQREIDVLVQEKGLLEEKKNELTILVEQYEKEIVVLQQGQADSEELEQARQALTALEDSKKELEEKLIETQEKLEDAHVQGAAQHDEFQALLTQEKEKQEALTAEVSKQNTRLEGVQAEHQDSIQAQERLEQELIAQKSAHKKEVVELEHEIEVLSEKSADFNGLFTRYSDLKDDYDSLEGSHQSISQEITQYKEREKDLLTKIAEQEQATNAEEENEELRRSLSHVKEQLEARVQQLHALESSLDTMVSQEDLHKAISSNRAQEESIQQRAQEYQQLHQEYVDLQTFTNLEIDAMEEEMDQLRAELSQSLDEAESNKESLQAEYEKKLAELQLQIQEVSSGSEKALEYAQQEQRALSKDYEEKLAAFDKERQESVQEAEERREEYQAKLAEQQEKNAQSQLLFEESLAKAESEKESIQEEYAQKLLALQEEERSGTKEELTSLQEEFVLLEESYEEEKGKSLQREEELARILEEKSLIREEKENIEESLRLEVDRLQELEEELILSQDSYEQRLEDEKEQRLRQNQQILKLEEELANKDDALMKLAQLEESLQQQEAEYAKQGDELRAAHTDVRLLETLKEDLLVEKERSNELEEEGEALQKIIDRQNDQIAVLEQSKEDAKQGEGPTVRDEEEISSLRLELNQANIMAQKFQFRVGMAEMRASAAEAELEQYKDIPSLEEKQSKHQPNTQELDEKLNKALRDVSHLERALAQKQEAFNQQQQDYTQGIQDKDQQITALVSEQELLREALSVAQQRWDEAGTEHAKEKASLERLATETALEEIEKERQRFLNEKDDLQEETLRVSRQVQELEQERDIVREKLEQLQEVLRVERLHHSDILEQERRAAELEKRLSIAEKTRITTKNKALKLKLKRHFELLRSELVQTKERLAELGGESTNDVPKWPFLDDDFL